MPEETGREQRKELEALQGRAKQARLELDAPESEGFSEELQRLTSEATAAESTAGQLEREARTTGRQLELVRHDVDEAERQLLAPKAISSVGPAVAALAVGLGSAGLWAMFQFIDHPPTMVLAGVMALLPPPLLAWLWRRRLSGGGTFRSPS